MDPHLAHRVERLTGDVTFDTDTRTIEGTVPVGEPDADGYTPHVTMVAKHHPANRSLSCYLALTRRKPGATKFNPDLLRVIDRTPPGRRYRSQDLTRLYHRAADQLRDTTDPALLDLLNGTAPR